jgi:hypothetical protein
MNTLIVLSLLIIRMVASFINDLFYIACHFKNIAVEETSLYRNISRVDDFITILV